MSFPAFILSGALAWAYYAYVGRVVALGWVTVWVAWFLAHLAVAGVLAARSRDRAVILGWLVMAVSTGASYTTWAVASDPLIDLAAKNLAVALSVLVIAPNDRRMIAVAVLHAVLILTAVAAAVGLVPGPAQRPRAFLAWSYPDIAAALRHAALIALTLPRGAYEHDQSDLVGTPGGRGYRADHPLPAPVARLP